MFLPCRGFFSASALEQALAFIIYRLVRGNMEYSGRRVDAITATFYAAGNYGQCEVVTAVSDFANAKLNLRRKALIVKRREHFHDAGVTGAQSQSGYVGGAVNATLCEAIIWQRALSDADAAVQVRERRIGQKHDEPAVGLVPGRREGLRRRRRRAGSRVRRRRA